MSWEQVGNSITFYAFFVASKVGKAGLSPTFDAYRPDGTNVVSNANAEEMGQGFYRYVLNGSYTTSGGVGEYLGLFKTTDETVDQKYIPALWVVGRAGVEYLDASIAARTPGLVQRSEPPTVAAVADQVWDELIAGHAGAGSTGKMLAAAADPLLNAVPGAYTPGTAGYALGRIGAAQVVVTQPVSANGTTLSLTRGDDYYADDGRAIIFLSASWPDLTDATEVRITVRRRSEALGGTDDVWFTAVDVEASRVAGAGTQSVVFELTAAMTGELIPVAKSTAAGKFDVQALIAGHVVTLVLGRVNVAEDQTRG